MPIRFCVFRSFDASFSVRFSISVDIREALPMDMLFLMMRSRRDSSKR